MTSEGKSGRYPKSRLFEYVRGGGWVLEIEWLDPSAFFPSYSLHDRRPQRHTPIAQIYSNSTVVQLPERSTSLAPTQNAQTKSRRAGCGRKPNSRRRFMGIASGGLFLAQGACSERGSPALAGCLSACPAWTGHALNDTCGSPNSCFL